MKVIHLARFCLIDKGPHASALLDDLAMLPIGAAYNVEPGADTLEKVTALYPDIVVVNGDAMPQALSAAFVSSLHRALDDGTADGGDIPLIVLLKLPRRADVYAASMAGYSAVMPYPTNSRVLYRRSAALLQKSRRESRRADQENEVTD